MTKEIVTTELPMLKVQLQNKQSLLIEKETMRNEYSRSIGNPGHFSKHALNAFKLQRKKLNKEIKNIKTDISNLKFQIKLKGK